MQNEVQTYIRGSQRINLFLVSNDLKHALRNSQILPYQSIVISDHLPVIIDLDTKALCGNRAMYITKPATRILHLEDTNKVEKYIEEVRKNFKVHNISNKIHKLTKRMKHSITPQNIQQYEEISELITRIQKKVEKTTDQKNKITLSIPIHKAIHLVWGWQEIVN